MKRKLVGAVLAVVALGMVSSSALAKPDYAKKEGVGCTTCHVKAGDKALNETGTCYQGKKDLAACKK
ncbi:MAG: hypothetical protein HY696_01800 [Deltaproteobacteria bacterium]|nr:hypothetical protein [Deltaproteobacteria bacterium]